MTKWTIAVAFLAAVVPAIAVAFPNPDSDLGNALVDGFFLGGTVEQRLSHVKSPDGRSVAILFHKQKRAPGGPPEPPKTLERWTRLKMLRNGKTLYDSGYENLNIYQMSPGFSMDVAWSPDSAHLAYRHITSLRIVGRDGKSLIHDVVPENSVISSFRWIDNERLLVVSKRTVNPLALFGRPYMYSGYTDQAQDVCITQLHLAKGKTERYRQAVDKVGSSRVDLQACKLEYSIVSPK